MVMAMQQFLRAISIPAIAFVVACNTGGSPTAGIDRGGIVSGPVTGYGSIWVNGSRYRTDDASITVNGEAATEADLAIGQVVLLDTLADNTSLRAKTIVYESNLRGPIESVDVVAGTFIALGQLVSVDAGTSFGSGIVPADITGLAQGNIVEVSGLVDNNGNIRATRVEREDSLDPIQLSGVASAVTREQFTVGMQVVDYSEAALIDGFPGGIVSDGDRVRVSAQAFGAAGAIQADAIAYRGTRVAVDEGEDGDIEGLITNFIGPESFRLAGFAVSTNAQTDFSGGTVSDLGENVRIEAEGEFDAGGTLIATEVEFRREGEARIEATVDSVDAVRNTVTVFGVDVEVTPLTRIEDKRDDMRPFNIADLEQGDFLKIEGSWIEDALNGNRVIATGLERIDGEDKFKLRGQLQSVNEPQFTLLGIAVQTDAGTSFEGGATDFFAAAAACAPDCLVEAAWDVDGGLLVADEVELED